MKMLTACLGMWLATNAWSPVGQAAEAGFRHFLYISNQRVVTVEMIDEGETILNYINLGGNYELLESTNLLILDTTGGGYRGHLFKRDQADAEGQVFQVTDLVEPRQFRGYSILGNFRFEAPPAAVYFRLGGRILELTPLTPEEFEKAADRVGNLDLEVENSTLAVYDAGFRQGVGRLLRAGTPEGDPITRLVADRELYPPIVLKNRAPRLLSKFSHLPDPVVVRIRLEVTALGGLVNHSVEEGVDPELDQIALEVVRNSWIVLPAISEGKTAGADLVVRVQFER